MSLNKYFSDLQEKLKASDSMSDWISDFQKSDAPQFAGKSKEKRRQMAIAAKLGAERGQQNETSIINLATKGRIKMSGDMGEPSYAARKKATELQQKIVDKKYINKIVRGAEGGITTNTGLVPEETKKTGKDDLPFEPDENITNKDEFGNTIKDRARHIARKAMKKAAEQGKGFGPSPADKLSIRKNEEVDLDEGKYGAFRLGPGVGRFSSRGRAQHQGLEDPRTGLPLGFSNPPKKDEPKKDEPKKVKEETSPMIKAPRNEFPTKSDAFAHAKEHGGKVMKKTFTHPTTGQQHVSYVVKEEVEQIDEISAEVAKRVAQARDRSAEKYKLTPTQSRRLGMGNRLGEPDLNAAQALKSAMKRGAKDVYKEEVEELDELNYSDLETRNKFSSDPQRRRIADKAREKLNKKSKDKDKDKQETDQVNEVSAKVAKLVAQRRDKDFREMTPTKTQERRMARGDWRADPSLQADKAYKSAVKRGAKDVYGYNEEVEELDEAIRHEIAGQVARFIGNKIDPVHGDIMHAHGKEAYRQAAYHIRGTIHHVSKAISDLHDRLHKQLRTGGLATEEVELDEISQELATKAYAKRSGTMSHDDPVARKKEDDAYERIGKRWGKKGQEKADAAADKYQAEEVEELDELSKEKLMRYADKALDRRRRASTRYRSEINTAQSDGEEPVQAVLDMNKKEFDKRTKGLKAAGRRLRKEEVEEIEEDGKLKGGAKDPCWKGYQMVGTKKKGGREVPNCVPREEKEYKTFKALKEELNGNSNGS